MIIKHLVDRVFVNFQAILKWLDVLLNVTDGQKTQCLKLRIILKMGNLEQKFSHFETGQLSEAGPL